LLFALDLFALSDARRFRGEAVRGMAKAKLIRSNSHNISGCLAIGARASMLHVIGSTSIGSRPLK
jgi:hypothetical protein